MTIKNSFYSLDQIRCMNDFIPLLNGLETSNLMIFPSLVILEANLLAATPEPLVVTVLGLYLLKNDVNNT